MPYASTKFAAMAALFIAGFSVTAMAETRTFNVEAFDRIKVSSGLEVELSVGAAQTIRAESDDSKVLGELDIKVRNGELRIELDRKFLDFIGGLGKMLSGGPGVTVFITAPVVTGLEARSGSEILARGMTGHSLTFEVKSGSQITASEIEAQFIEVDGSTGAAAELLGTCARLQADVSTGAILRLGRLECMVVHAEASTGARVTVRATQTIKAEASSGGQVNVSGNPTSIDTDTSSGGDVDFRSN